MADGRLLELTLAAVRRLCRNGRLQVGIEHLVGVELRAVTGQVEDFDIFLVLLQPRLHGSCVMHFQVVQHQEHFAAVALSDLLHQPLHEVDQDGGIHGALEDLEAHLAPVGDAGDEGQALAALVDLDLRCLAHRGIGASTHIIGAQPGLVRPVDFGTLKPGSVFDGGVLLIKPALDRCGLLLVGAPDGLLRGEAPAAQVQAHSLRGQAHAAALLDQPQHRLARPQGKVHLELIRSAVDDQAADVMLLVLAQRAQHTDRTPCGPVEQGFGAAGIKPLADVEHAGARQAQIGCDGFVRPASTPQLDDLAAPLLPRFRGKFPHVDHFHGNYLGA